MHLVRLDLEHVIGQNILDGMYALAADCQNVASLLAVIFGDTGTSLHVIGNQPVVDNAELDHMRGIGESGVGLVLVADMHVIGDVVRPFGPYLRRTLLDCRAHVDCGGTGCPVNADAFGGEARLRFGFGHDKSDGVADMADMIFGEDRVGRQFHLAAVRIGHWRLAGNAAQMRHIGMRQDQLDALLGARGFKVGDLERRVGVRAAQHCAKQRIARRDIVSVAAKAGNQPCVLDALDRLANSKFHRLHAWPLMCC